LTKLELLALAENCEDVIATVEDELLNNVADYLASGNIDIPTAQWKIKMLAELGRLDRANIETIAQRADILPAMQREAMEISALDAINDLEPGFRELVAEGILNGTAVPMSDTALLAVATYEKQAADTLNKVNTVMRYYGRADTAALINNVAEIATKQQYLDILNAATGKVVTGAASRQTAMRQCIRDMSQAGIPAFIDKAGRRWTPEAYINMDIRTTCTNVAHQAQFDRMDEYGVDLIEVSSHAGARPLCAPYQGAIYDRNGTSTKYPSWRSTSYGEPAGLLGINCGHFVYPYIENVSIQRYFPYDKEENDRLYREKQKQRALERDVRSSKRECSMLDRVGDKQGFSDAAVRLKQKQAKYDAYCEKTGLSPKRDRLQQSDFNRSVSAKVNAAAKEHDLTNAKNQRILREKIASGEISIKLNPDKQAPHILGSAKYNPADNKSYFIISSDELQRIVMSNYATGHVQITKKGQIKETISVGSDIGTCLDIKGASLGSTNRFTIHYSKSRTHAVPTIRRITQ
jgi:hypothetical protein